MVKIVFYTVLSFLLFVTSAMGQQTFSERAKAISEEIKKITAEEKQALKLEIEKIDQQLEEGEISQQQAEDAKLTAANLRAENIEKRVAVQQELLNKLVHDKIDESVAQQADTTKNKIIVSNDSWHVSIKNKNKRPQKRTTSQFVLAFGLNNVVNDSDISSVEDSDFKVAGSRFFEWGFSWNSRLFKNHNLLHAKYGFSFMYNNLRPTQDRIFQMNGAQTDLVVSERPLRDNRFKNVHLVFPVHLEFDFSPKKTKADGTSYFRTHKGFRLGIGGYGGFNLKTKQISKFGGQSGRVVQKADFNTADIIYGLSTYVGYRATSLYLKYDMNSMFKNNVVDQNNISLGIRFDFN
jgi:hypothetical protein